MDGGYQFGGQRGELGIDHEDAVGAGEHAGGSAGAFEHVEVGGEFGGFDFHFAEVGGLGG